MNEKREFESGAQMARKLLRRDGTKPEDYLKDFRRPSRDDDDDDMAEGAKLAAKLLGKAPDDDDADDEKDEDDKEIDKRLARRIERDVLRSIAEDERRARMAKKSAPVKKPVPSVRNAKPREKVTVYRGAALGRLLATVGLSRIQTTAFSPAPVVTPKS